MSVDSAYGSKGWEFESLRARFCLPISPKYLRKAAEVDLLTVAAFVCLLFRICVCYSGTAISVGEIRDVSQW
jgi:hypothetical protein